MQYNIDTGTFQVVMESTDINAVVGENARIQVEQAIDYIRSGQAEIEEAVQQGIASFDSNATQKTTAFNTNAGNRLSEYNSNADNKLEAYNNNASAKVSAYDQNASDKTTAFNNNATSKTGDFNDNATSKTTDFNTNASNKTDSFNLNASNKTTDFNDNYTAKKALIDAQVGVAEGVATTATTQAGIAKQWAIGGPSEPTGNSAKYWAEQASSTLSGLTTRVSTIEDKIPSDASSSNQLADKDWVENKGYITGITSGDVTTALGYTPYNSSNPDGYQTASDVATAISGKQDTLVSGTNIKTINSTALLGSGDVAVQETLVSGTNIKTINSNSILGSGDITIDSLPSQSGQSGKFLTTNGTSASWATVTATVTKDNLSITENSSSQLQAIGVINQRNTSTAIKTWTGTKTQYNAITTKDANTLYNITDDSNVTVTLLEALYPVGSIYITTAASCPLTTLISGSTWTLQSSAIVTSVNTNVPIKGNGKTLGLTNGTDVLGPQNWGVDLECRPDCYDKNVGYTTGNVGVTVNACVGMTTDASKSGVVGTVTRSTLSVNIFKRTA